MTKAAPIHTRFSTDRFKFGAIGPANPKVTQPLTGISLCRLEQPGNNRFAARRED
jgi:hypothetical protein